MNKNLFSIGDLVVYKRPLYAIDPVTNSVFENIPAIILKYRKLLKTVDILLQKNIEYGNSNTSILYNIHISSVEKISQ